MHGEAEIGEFDVALRVHQDVIALDIYPEWWKRGTHRDGFGSWSGERRERGGDSDKRRR